MENQPSDPKSLPTQDEFDACWHISAAATTRHVRALMRPILHKLEKKIADTKALITIFERRFGELEGGEELARMLKEFNEDI